MSFGTPRSSGARATKTFAKLKDGSLAFRILPPIGQAAQDGVWSKFIRVHFGYKNSEGKLRPFESSFVKDHKTKEILVRDAALERLEKLEVEMEKAKEANNTELVAKLTKLIGNGKEFGQYNLDSNHYVNALDAQGNIVVLKLRHKAMLALLSTRKTMMEADGVDPVSENGRYLVFSRSGMGLETVFSVTALQETVKHDGKTFKQDVEHVADESIARRCVRENPDGTYTYLEAADLYNLFPKPTAEEIEQIVKEGATAIDRIFGTPKAAPVAASSAAESVEDLPEGDLGSEYAIPPPTKTTAAAAAKAVEKVLSQPVPRSAAQTPKAVAPEQTDADIDDFLASLG